MLEICVAGVRCRISLLFPAVLVLLLCFDDSGLAAFGFLAALLHECGHLLALLLFRCKPASLRFSLFGMCLTLPSPSQLSDRRQVIVALAGPSVNAFCAALLFLLKLPPIYAWMHLGLLLLNLLPVLPLDGGQALQAVLSARLTEEAADRWAFLISLGVFCPMLVVGTLVLLTSGYNFTLLAVALYVGLLMIFRKRN